MNGTINYSSGGTTAPYDYETTATYHCNLGHVLTTRDSEKTCTGDGRSPSGQWDGAAPQCPRMSQFYYCNWSCHMILYTQLWTVGLLRLLPMDFLGYQQPQHSQGQ